MTVQVHQVVDSCTGHIRTIVKFQALAIKLIPQEYHKGDCLKELSLTFKLLLIEQIIGEIG